MSEDILESKQTEDETSTEDSSTSENKDETSKGEEDASDEESGKQTTGEESGEGSEGDDYANELERVKRSLGQAEKKIVKLKTKGVDPDEITEKIWSKIDERLSARELTVKQNSYEYQIKSVSTNESEAKLIKHHLENTIKPTGNVEEDVATAKLLANRSKIMKTNKELANSLRTRSTVGTAPSFNGAKMDAEDSVQLSPEEKKLIAWAERRTGKKANLNK